MMSDGPIRIKDPAGAPIGMPFLFIPLYERDDGGSAGRQAISEWRERRPLGVTWLSDEQVELTVCNGGMVASDLIKVEYQFVFCTAQEHGPADGFVIEHAGQAEGSTLDLSATIAFVSARSSKRVRLTAPPWPADHPLPLGTFSNIYFRARVSTLWTRPTDVAGWDFVNDSRVVESYRQVTHPPVVTE